MKSAAIKAQRVLLFDILTIIVYHRLSRAHSMWCSFNSTNEISGFKVKFTVDRKRRSPYNMKCKRDTLFRPARSIIPFDLGRQDHPSFTW